MYDHYKLIRNQELAEYWKKNNIYSDLNSQLKIILHAYIPVQEKIDILKNYYSNTVFKVSISNSISTEEIVNYLQKGLNLYNEEDPNNMYIYTITDIVEENHEEFGYRNPNANVYFNNTDRNNIVKLCDNEDLFVEQFIVSKESGDVNMHLQYHMRYNESIKDHEIVYIYDYERFNKIDEIGTLYSFCSKEIKLYPYVKVSIKTPYMSKPISKYLSCDIDDFGSQYYYLSDDKDFDIKTNYSSDYIMDPTENIIGGYDYNFYDWIEEIKE